MTFFKQLLFLVIDLVYFAIYDLSTPTKYQETISSKKFVCCNPLLSTKFNIFSFLDHIYLYKYDV